MRLASALAVLVASALAGTRAANDDAKPSAETPANLITEDSEDWGEFHPGASEALYLELGDEASGRGKVVFQQDDEGNGVVTCYLADAPLSARVYTMTLQNEPKPALEADKGSRANADSKSGGIKLRALTGYDKKKVPYAQYCAFTRAAKLDWEQLISEPDFFRGNFTWKVQANGSFIADSSKVENEPARRVTAELRSCTDEGVDCFLPQSRIYDLSSDDGFYYAWNTAAEQVPNLAPESGFPKQIVADVNNAFYGDVGNPQTGTGIVTVNPLDDGSGSLICFFADRVKKTEVGIIGAYLSNKTTSEVGLSWVSALETMDPSTKFRNSMCSWIPSTLVSPDQIMTLANGWDWTTVDHNAVLAEGAWTTKLKPCSSRGDSLCDLSKATFRGCSHQQGADLPMCSMEFGSKISLPTKFAGDASDAFYVEVGNRLKGKLIFQKDERNAAIVACFTPEDAFPKNVNATIHLMDSRSLDVLLSSDVDFTASYSALSDGRALQDCSLNAYTKAVWDGLLSVEWKHMTYNMTLTSDHQPRISMVGKPSPPMDCAKASGGGCELLDFVGCASEDVFSHAYDPNHCTFEGKEVAPAPM